MFFFLNAKCVFSQYKQKVLTDSCLVYKILSDDLGCMVEFTYLHQLIDETFSPHRSI